MDLKPENIMFTSDKNLIVKIIDFGLSHILRGIETDSGKIDVPSWGTPNYMAPEVFLQQTTEIENMKKCDLWSVGMIMYYLVCWEFPFDSSSIADHCEQVVYSAINFH